MARPSGPFALILVINSIGPLSSPPFALRAFPRTTVYRASLAFKQRGCRAFRFSLIWDLASNAALLQIRFVRGTPRHRRERCRHPGTAGPHRGARRERHYSAE